MPPSSRSPTPPTKRLLQELKAQTQDPAPFLHSLSPASESELLSWEAVMKGVPGTPYEAGLWHLSLQIPPAYPLSPPTIRFTTPVIHPNVSFRTGEICLSLLSSEHWSPAYTLRSTLEAVWMLLGEGETDSPLNVDVAVLLRGGDKVGAEGLVRWACREWRWRG